ncbi:MAG: hypothetical protein KDI44_04620 [Thiothrix sp.]|nr:hypothetical protein [Thiothrix sp.]HPQ94861.1 hypothetical protein [Thiolinea sp.]
MINLRSPLGGALLLLLALSLGGCVVAPAEPRPTATVPEIIQLSRQKVPPDQIVARMRASGTYYHLSASQLADLRRQGVSDQVIDYMQLTYLEAVRRNQAMRDFDRWDRVDGWWYGGYGYGWRDPWVYRPVYVPVRPRPHHGSYHPNRPKPDRPKPDRPKPDRPKPDRPKPHKPRG